MDATSTRLPAPGILDLWADRNFRWLVVAPAIFLILLIGLFPLIYSLVVSVQNITMTREDTSFRGLLQYGKLFHDLRLWSALGQTLVMTAIALPIEFMLGLLLARLFLDPMPGRQFLIALLILPTVIAPVASGATWRLMFDNRFGPINQVLGWFAGEPVPIQWTLNNNSIVVYTAILVCEIWQWTPFMFLILLAGLSNVDRSQLEAAEIDGAGWWRIFFRIMLPAIRPVVLVALTIRGLDLFRIFDIVWVLTRGGPGTMTETISVYAYVQGFQQFATSYTAAIAFAVIVLLSVVVMWTMRRAGVAR
jgi:multiple sugar transport system permease protein